MANKPQRFQYDSTGTGATDHADYPTGVSAAYARFDNVTTSTKQKVKLQGSVGGSGDWFDISAVTTLTTTLTGVASTGFAANGMIFDRVRVNVTGGTTNTGTNTVYIIAKE